MLTRNLLTSLIQSVKHSPVVFLGGARQTGKSTLVREMLPKSLKADYFTFDDAHTLDLASTAPQEFIESIKLPAIIDEVQMVEGIARAIKLAVDQNRRPSMFILTGSASLMVLPKLADALVGRMQTRTLYPLSQGELSGVKEDFLQTVFDGQLKMSPESTARQMKHSQRQMLKEDLAQRILRGGFPVAALETDDQERREWFGAYLSDVIRREIRQISDIERLSSVPNLLTHIASSTGGLLNMTGLGGRIGLPTTTMSRYLTILQATYMVNLVKPWSSKLTSTLTKSPKLYLLDTGLASYLLNLDKSRLLADDQLFGRLLENFVFAELIKQIGWSKLDCEIFHFRTRTGFEIDFVIKNRDGRLLPIEVKLSKSVNEEDFRAIDYFAGQFMKNYHRGIILYCGKRLIAFGNNRWALPIDMLWQAT